MQSRKILWLFIGCLFFKFILFDLDWSLNTTFSSFSFPQTYLTKFLLASLLAVPFLYIRSRWYLITVGTLIDLLLIVNLMYFRTYYTSIPWDSLPAIFPTLLQVFLILCVGQIWVFRY